MDYLLQVLILSTLVDIPMGYKSQQALPLWTPARLTTCTGPPPNAIAQPGLQRWQIPVRTEGASLIVAARWHRTGSLLAALPVLRALNSGAGAPIRHAKDGITTAPTVAPAASCLTAMPNA